MYSGERTGTTQDPYLSVTYTTPSFSSSTTTNPVTYSYDAFDARTTKSATVTSTGVVTTSKYPSSGYSVDGSTTTVYLSGPSSSSLASILNTGTTSSATSTIATDHLGSTAVLSDTSGIMTELLDYHGYGNSRLTSGTTTAKKTFIGQYSDSETSLSYLNARYYDSTRGQFMSEDSVFLGMGTDGKTLNELLIDPQLQNSYSYARDNPITLKDADGKFAFSDLAGYALHPINSFNRYVAIPAAMAVLNYLKTPPTFESLDSAMIGSFVPGGKAVQLAKPVVGAARNIGKIAAETMWGDALKLEDHAARHASEFGSSTLREYARTAQSFLQKAINGAEGVQKKVGSDGVIRMWEGKTNTFGSFNADGTTRTFFKPTSPSYWDRNSDGWGKSVESIFLKSKK